MRREYGMHRMLYKGNSGSLAVLETVTFLPTDHLVPSCAFIVMKHRILIFHMH